MHGAKTAVTRRARKKASALQKRGHPPSATAVREARGGEMRVG